MSYLIRYGKIFDSLFPKRIWRKKGAKVYLTFDDGPTDNLTQPILQILKERNVKATFFCVGANIKKRKSVTKELMKDGHVLANHTQTHMNGAKANKEAYLKSVEECRVELEKIGVHNKLFRPPHGRLKKGMISALSSDYQVIMWTFLAADFDGKRKPSRIIRSADRVKSGDIIVFHDNEKFTDKVLGSLPAFLDALINRGIEFDVL